MEKLKNCPFCGGNASHVYNTEVIEAWRCQMIAENARFRRIMSIAVKHGADQKTKF